MMMDERSHLQGDLYVSPAPSTMAAPSQPSYSPYALAPNQPSYNPYAHSLDSYRDEPDAAYPPPSPDGSGMLLPSTPPVRAAHSAAYGDAGYTASTGAYVPGRASAQERKKRRLIGLGALAALIVVAAAVVIPVYFFVIKKHNDGSKSTSSNVSAGGGGGGGSGNSNTGGTGPARAISGGNGSTVFTTSGQSFVYNNSFGGFWVDDATDPFLNGAQPNSWTPPLNQSWNWGTDRIYGVNLGGWFVLEPFIAPALFQKYPSAPDEWTLTTLMRADGSLNDTLENHYDTFITEEDMAQIAGAGLNWVRIPIPFWAISTWSDVGQDLNGTTVAEPFLESVCWKYILRALGWARKYGLRVNLDIHTAPGSQNGYNHSGKLGQVNFLNGPMGVANAQRMLDYIRIIIEFVSQDEYKDLVPMVGIVNEALMSTIGRTQLTNFYLEAHNMIRGITGYGEGNGPYISIHDGFDGVASWAGFLPGSDRIILDTHPYFAFDQQPNDSPIATSEDPAQAGGIWPKQACSSWGPSLNTSRTAFGVTVAGEFSNGYNDCGLFLTGVNGTAFYGGDCSLWEDSTTWNASVKAGVMQFALASMDATQDWFFWTWKIGAAADGGVRSPLWSYQLGLQGGWMPQDPRSAVGAWASRGVVDPPFDGTFSAWQTGGAGAGTIAPTATAEFGQWPPTSIAHVNATAQTVLPTYTPTAAVTTLMYTTPAPTPGAGATEPTPTVSVGNGWVNAADTALAMTAVAGCTYPDAWNALSQPAPTALCTGA
ncbi:glycoside hydrolase family 5 protein [Mycena pura]|uniref:glucan 1,3-beta-glucosidase n=1 Tax=Mycena pura TaxID=153505 RepID=A0AAD6VJW4_9AGAR|nr:glycoside hydrolase family 5 protein [Mycena pura]